MKVKANTDKGQMIIRGIEPREYYEIEVDLGTLTESQRTILAGMTSPTIFGAVEGTSAEVRAYLQAEVESEAKEQAERDRVCREACATAVLGESEGVECGVKYQTWQLPYISAYSLSSEVRTMYDRTIARLVAEKETRNAASLLAAEADIQVAQEAQARAKAEQQAAKAANFAERLATGILTIEMERGDRRDWGEPWIAKVASRNGRKPEYDFSAGSYDVATETLSIPCKPGEVIAYGQKNYRKPKRTIHNIRKMREDGGLVEA
jgi:hypothetical protein